MQSWIEGFQESIDFIEQNLSELLDIEEIAGKAALSGAGDTHSDLDKGSIPMRELLERANNLTPNASYTLECYSFEESIDWLKKEGFIK